MEKFCLKWDDFSQNVGNTFEELREDTDITDVTLVSEDRQQIAAHKVILSASNPFFREILKQNKNPHPLIYMRGMKAKDLVFVVDFIYHGEVNIYQEELNNFLDIGEELELKGLTGGVTVGDSVEPGGNSREQTHDIDRDGNEEHINARITKVANTLIAANSDDYTKLDEQILSMMTKLDQGWKCNTCGRLDKRQSIEEGSHN